MISPEQIGFFHDNGYLKCGRILDSKQVEEMRAGLDRVLELEAAGGDDSHHEFGFGHRRGGEDYPEGRVITQFINMWKREAMYAHIMHHPVIAGVVYASARHSPGCGCGTIRSSPSRRETTGTSSFTRTSTCGRWASLAW